jgi:hypothetical protein
MGSAWRLVAVSLVSPVVAAGVVGNGTPGSCNGAALDAALVCGEGVAW